MKNVLRSLAVASLLVSSAAYAGSGKGLAVDAAVKTGQGGLVGSVLGNTRVNANAALGGKSGLKVDVNTKGKEAWSAASSVAAGVTAAVATDAPGAGAASPLPRQPVSTRRHRST